MKPSTTPGDAARDELVADLKLWACSPRVPQKAQLLILEAIGRLSHIASEKAFNEHLTSAERVSQHAAIKGAGHTVRSSPDEHSDKNDETLRAELEQERDIRATREIILSLVADGLGVEHEPHQTFDERLLEASCAPRTPATHVAVPRTLADRLMAYARSYNLTDVAAMEKILGEENGHQQAG